MARFTRSILAAKGKKRCFKPTLLGLGPGLTALTHEWPKTLDAAL